MSDSDEQAPDSSDDERSRFERGGVRVGDFVVRATPAFATSAEHDTLRNTERAERARDDARAAQANGVVAPAFPALGPSPRPIAPRSELDDALDAARAEAADPEQEVPILVRDPVTGLEIKVR